jgi:hypothetical protein
MENLKEESPYKPDIFHLRSKKGACSHFCPQRTTNQNQFLFLIAIIERASDRKVSYLKNVVNFEHVRVKACPRG